MKYLKLFEAFQSNTISKMLNFLTSKIGESSQARFLDRLKTIQNKLDIPIDKIEDKDVLYLNRRKAIPFRNQEQVDNEKGIYCLKFWFSLEDGFLGFTSTGNAYYEYKNRRRSSDSFDDYEIEYIKNTFGITKGELEPLKDYEDLQHGTLIFGIFSESSDDRDRLGYAKIWRDGDRLWAIQSVADGGNPDYDVNGENWRSYRNIDNRFRNSWSLDSVNSPGDDHHKLHLYRPTDDPLHIKGNKKVQSVDENPLNYNLPTNSRLNVGDWNDYDWSISSSSQIEKADFAIVIVIDNILKSGLKPVTDTRKERETSREGALKLMSDDEIKNANIDRYMTQILSKMINVDTTEIKDLQNIVLKNVCNQFAYIAIYKNNPSLDYLDYISKNLFRALQQTSVEDKKYFINNAKSKYERLYKSSTELTKLYRQSKDIINNQAKDDVKELFMIVDEISNKIYNYLKSQKIETLEDLRMIYLKIQSIKMATEYEEFELSRPSRNLIAEFNYPNDVDYYLREYLDRDFNDDIKRLKQVSRYVDSILR